jgi:hypothetical protein
MARRKRQDRGRLAKHAHNCGSFPSIRGEAEAWPAGKTKDQIVPTLPRCGERFSSDLFAARWY